MTATVPGGRQEGRIIPWHYTRAAFPLGGIGTGNVSLGAGGDLRDWELENRPDKDRRNPFSFFAIRASARDGSDPWTRILEATPTGRHDWDEGYNTDRLAGLPRFAASRMRGEYPIVEISFEDPGAPVAVALTAFTPLIPLESRDSGIPGAILRYRVTNTSPHLLDVSVVGSLSHIAGMPIGERWPSARLAVQSVRYREEAGLRGLDFDIDLAHDDLAYGTMSLTTRDPGVTHKAPWLVGIPQDAARLFWDDLVEDGLLQDDRPDEEASIRDGSATDVLTEIFGKNRTGSLAIARAIEPGETYEFEFALSWCFPNRPNGWGTTQPGFTVPTDPGADQDRRVHNYYATIWPDAWSAGAYLLGRLPDLEAGTRRFHWALYGSSLDPAVVDSLGTALATLRSTTCFRIDDGTFLGWEGSLDREGCCPGTCTHVWSYAQAVAWLFPDLERSVRSVEFLRETDADGMQEHRSNRMFDQEPWSNFGAAVDGQLGSLIRLYREWRFSGDDGFLSGLWPAARRSMDYALRTWDTDGDGLLDARMLNTYDISFVGVEPLANTMLVAALQVMSTMATHLGDSDAADRYREFARRSAARVDAELYNGEYYQQRGVVLDTDRYQYGDGVLSDQLLGQFHAFINGLGFILDEQHVRRAIEAVYRYNFRADLRGVINAQRAFAVPGERGLILASWPHGGRPRIPFIYSDEVWTGVEYQVASTLVYCGAVEEGLSIVRAVRSRHTGEHRSPWNEIEAGNHYARSMSAWGLLLAFTGVQYDGPRRSLSFDPVMDGEYLFTTGTGWGRVAIDPHQVRLVLDGGTLRLASLALRGQVLAEDIELDAGGSMELPIGGAA